MAFDGIVTNSLVKELKNKIVNGRINKVYQPESDEIFLHIRNNRENFSLLISASANNPRFHLTKTSKKNPMKAPMFCMILRKYLEGATILNVEQVSMDRIIFIDVSSRDELGIDSEKRLVLEIMGRHSNLILIDKESGKIIDSITRVTEDMSRVRQVLPGLTYNFPPEQDKKNPLTTCLDEFFYLLEIEKATTPVFKFFYFNYLGLSPLISREFCFNANVDKNTKIKDLTDDMKHDLFNSFKLEMDNINNNIFKPCLIYDDNQIRMKAFHALNLRQFGENAYKIYFNSISELLDEYFSKKDHYDRILQKNQSLKRIVQVHLDRAINKLNKQEKEFDKSKDREIYKVYADLISANLYHIESGSKEITVQNFYDENLANIEIPLDEKYSAPINAQRYYKRYSRLKNAYNRLKLQIPETKSEIFYLENILVSIDNSTEFGELEEIEDGLVKDGYIKKSKKKSKAKTIESNPHHYKTSDGIDILVGKNNRQNDRLTFKNSSRDDTWLHVQKMPGSHVIIKNNGQKLSKETLEIAGHLAAYYSSARAGSNVPIDWTERKHVKKPKGAKPGLVIYDNFETIFVTPDIKVIRKLEKIN